MAARTTPTPSGRPGPNLSLVGPSRGMTPEARADEAAMEAEVLRVEAEAHTRRMRLAMQTRLFDTELFRPVAKRLLTEIERYERQLTGGEDAA